VQHSIVIASKFFNISSHIAVRPITLGTDKYRTKVKLGSRHCGNLVLDVKHEQYYFVVAKFPENGWSFAQ